MLRKIHIIWYLKKHKTVEATQGFMDMAVFEKKFSSVNLQGFHG